MPNTPCFFSSPAKRFLLSRKEERAKGKRREGKKGNESLRNRFRFSCHQLKITVSPARDKIILNRRCSASETCGNWRMELTVTGRKMKRQKAADRVMSFGIAAGCPENRLKGSCRFSTGIVPTKTTPGETFTCIQGRCSPA